MGEEVGLGENCRDDGQRIPLKRNCHEMVSMLMDSEHDDMQVLLTSYSSFDMIAARQFL